MLTKSLSTLKKETAKETASLKRNLEQLLDAEQEDKENAVPFCFKKDKIDRNWVNPSEVRLGTRELQTVGVRSRRGTDVIVSVGKMLNIQVDPNSLPKLSTVMRITEEGRDVCGSLTALESADMAPSGLQAHQDETTIKGIPTHAVVVRGINSKGEVENLTIGGNEILEGQQVEQEADNVVNQFHKLSRYLGELKPFVERFGGDVGTVPSPNKIGLVM